MDMLNDGRKWIAVAIVIASIILYLGMTRSHRDCIKGFLDGSSRSTVESAMLQCGYSGR